MANVNTMLPLQTVYDINAYIGVLQASQGGEWTYAPLGAGIDNLGEALNETVNQYFFLNDKGFANNYVTGMAPTFTMSGRRVIGDAAQEYIFGNKYELGAARLSNFKLEYTNADGATVTMTANCTIANMQEWQGAPNDASAISFELRFNGKPVVTITPAGA